MKKTITFSIILIILSIPIIIYAFQFFNSLSDNHQRWAEFGSYFGGVYSPIFSCLVLLVLLSQTDAQIKFNKHQIDQTYISRNEKDIE